MCQSLMPSSRMKFYGEADKDPLGFVKTLPHWRWVNEFIGEVSPETVTEANQVNHHGLKVAGGIMNGLAFTFSPVSGHRDSLGN